MTSINANVEIDKNTAREMVKKGSKLIWVLEPMDEMRHAILQEISETVYSIYFDEINRASDPKKLVGDEPILVCEHGITSLFVANRLRNQGIQAYSLDGGIEELRKW